MNNKLLIAYAKRYKAFDLNITCIGSTRNEFNLLDNNLFKAPNHAWSVLADIKQSEDGLLMYDWHDAVGLGTVLGYNGLMAIDIDGCIEYDLVRAVLKLLQLPSNYKWVVKSGSGAGYHILFFCNDIDIDKEKISKQLANTRWEYVDDFGFPEVNAFYPKNAYQARTRSVTACDNDKINPILKNGVVEEIHGTDYDYYCINELFRKMEFRWKGHLVLPPSMHQSGQYYEFIGHFPDYKPHEVNFKNVREVYEKFCSKKSEWSGGDNIRANIAEEDSNNFEESFESQCTYLFFDTETNGLPLDYKKPASKDINWPKLVQLAWTICDQFGNQIKRENFIVKPQGFKISDESYQIHGISNDAANLIGVELKRILYLFLNDVEKVKCVVAHNYEFDANVIVSEIIRIGLNQAVLTEKQSICTMSSSVDYCGLKNSYGNKLPSLLELYKKLFGKNIQAHHSAGYDVILLEMCFWRLLKLGIIKTEHLWYGWTVLGQG